MSLFIGALIFLISLFNFNSNSLHDEYTVSSILENVPEEYSHVKYRYGANNPKRYLDCSSFVQHIYKKKFGISIPRTTKFQAKVGISIPLESVKTGDLVLLYTNRSKTRRHIGIYLNHDRFLHISQSNDVHITSLNKMLSYDGYSFMTARQVINFHEYVNLDPLPMTNLTQYEKKYISAKKSLIYDNIQLGLRKLKEKENSNVVENLIRQLEYFRNELHVSTKLRELNIHYSFVNIIVPYSHEKL